jgi:hypothetical protein
MLPLLDLRQHERMFLARYLGNIRERKSKVTAWLNRFGVAGNRRLIIERR